MSTEHFLVDFFIGLIAGVVGGLTGLGGAIVMLPALGLYHGYETRDQDRHHVFMAASMIVNIVVALSARSSTDARAWCGSTCSRSWCPRWRWGW